MKSLVENLGLKGITLFALIIVLKPFYEEAFPYADTIIIAVAAFLIFWYLEVYFSFLREGIQKEIDESKKDLKNFEEFSSNKFSVLETSLAETHNKIGNTELLLITKLTEMNNDVNGRFKDVLAINNETKTDINKMHNSLESQIGTVSENMDKTIGVAYQKVEEKQNILSTELGCVKKDVTNQLNDVLGSGAETKESISVLQNDLVNHIDQVNETANQQGVSRTQKLIQTVAAFSKFTDERFTTTLSELKHLQDLTKTNDVSTKEQVLGLRKKQEELADKLQNVKYDLDNADSKRHTELDTKISELKDTIGVKHEALINNLSGINESIVSSFRINESKQNELAKMQSEMLETSKKNFEDVNVKTKQQSNEQSNLVKDAIKGIAGIGTAVALLKGEVEKTVDGAKDDLLNAFADTKRGLDKTIVDQIEELKEEIEENHDEVNNSFVENTNGQAQIAQVLEDLTNNIGEQRFQIDGVGNMIREVENKVDEQSVQVDQIEKNLKNIKGDEEPQVRTETFEDKKENTILINTLKDNLLEYSELRDNKKIAFASSYEKGKLVYTKSFDEKGNVVSENKFYENGELKERKTYYVQNGKTKVEVETF